MNNVGFQGTLVINGNGVGVVVCTGERSQFGEVFRMMQAEDPPRHVRCLVLNSNIPDLNPQMILNLRIHAVSLLVTVTPLGFWKSACKL